MELQLTYDVISVAVNGVSLEGTILIESMSVSRNESDAIVKRTSNVNDVRCGKRTDNESVLSREYYSYSHTI